MSSNFSWELAFFSYCASRRPLTIAAPCRIASLCGISSRQLARAGAETSATNMRYRGASSLAANSTDSSNLRQLHVPALMTVDVEQLQLGAGIFFVLRQQKTAYDRRSLQDCIALRNQFAPIGPGRG